MLLDIENLTKTFPGVNNTSPVEVLKGLELKVEEGETTAIIGQSGSGKSTLLSLLAGLDQPTSGTLKLKERHLDSMSEEELTQFRAENIGIIFQQFHLMTHLNALENVSLPLEMNHQQDALELAEKALEQVGLGSRMDHFPHQLSGGECQRVAIARAIVIRPALLLADEPSGNLDHDTGEQVADLLFDLVGRTGMTMVLVTHNSESSVSEITYPIPAVGTKSRAGSKRLWLWFRLAFKELLNHRRFSIFFILNLSLGLAGFIALDSFQVSLDRHLTRNSKSILGADISISSRMPVPPETLNQLEQMLPSPWEASKKIHFVTMAANESNSRLIQLVAIENGFPYYGKLVLGNQKNANPKMVDEELIKAGKLWAYPELLITLGLEIGDTLRLGEVDFIVGDVVLEDPSSAFNTFGVAPRVYVGLPQAMETGLLTQKSRVYYENLYKFSDHQEIQKLEDELENKIRLMGNSNERIRVRTHEDASENLGRVLGYLNDYLGLIALIALFLASIGAAYLFRSFLQTRFREMAVLMSLGAHRRETFQVVIWQLVLMGTLASMLAMLFSVLLLPALPMLLEEFLPRGFETMVRVRSLWLALMIGSIGSIVFCLPVIYPFPPIKK